MVIAGKEEGEGNGEENDVVEQKEDDEEDNEGTQDVTILVHQFFPCCQPGHICRCSTAARNG